MKKYNYHKTIWKTKMIIFPYKSNIVYEKTRELLKPKNKDDNPSNTQGAKIMMNALMHIQERTSLLRHTILSADTMYSKQ